MSAESDAWVRSEAQAMLDALPPGLLVDPASRDVFSGLAICYATVRLHYRQRTLGLRLLRDAETIRPDFLPALGAQVGLTPDVPFVRRLSEPAWRRALTVAGSAWRSRGTGYRDPLIAFVGVVPFIVYWAEGRLELAAEGDEYATFPVPYLRAATVAARRKTLILVPDLGGEYPDSGLDGVDRDMVREVIAAFRPLTQRVDLQWVDVVEDFMTFGVMRWRVNGNGTLVADADAGKATLEKTGSGGFGLGLGGAQYAVATLVPNPAAAALMVYGITECWLEIEADNDGSVDVRVRSNEDGDRYRAIRLAAVSDDPDAGEVGLVRADGAGEVLVGFESGVELHVGLPIHLQVACFPAGASDLFTVWVNGRLVLQLDAPADALTVGAAAVATSAPTVVFGPVIQYQPHDEFERVGPAGE